jgi:hypothetical protein
MRHWDSGDGREALVTLDPLEGYLHGITGFQVRIGPNFPWIDLVVSVVRLAF